MKKLLVISLLFIGLSSCNQKSEIQKLVEQQEAENKTAKLESEYRRACLALNLQQWEIGKTNGKWNHDVAYEEWVKTNPVKY